MKELSHMLPIRNEMGEPDQALESAFSIGDIHIGTIEDASAV